MHLHGTYKPTPMPAYRRTGDDPKPIGAALSSAQRRTATPRHPRLPRLRWGRLWCGRGSRPARGLLAIEKSADPQHLAGRSDPELCL